MSVHFQSWLASQFQRFVALKRAGGAKYVCQERLLAQFDTYLDGNAPEAPLRQETMTAFLSTLDRLSPRGRDNMVDVVWPALAFARRHGACIDNQPPRPPKAPPNFRLRPVRFVSCEEIGAIIAAARCLLPVHHLRSATYATLCGLLFATGMRISEALALDVEVAARVRETTASPSSRPSRATSRR